MTVVRLKGKTPHPLDEGLRARLEKYRLPGFAERLTGPRRAAYLRVCE